MTVHTPLITTNLINKVYELSSIGKSPVQIAAELRMPVKKFNNLVNSHYESDDMKIALREAFDLGATFHEAHFESVYIDAMLGQVKDCKEGLIKAYMQNKFKWMDKSEVNTIADSIQNLTDEELTARRKVLLEKLNAS